VFGHMWDEISKNSAKKYTGLKSSSKGTETQISTTLAFLNFQPWIQLPSSTSN